MKWVLLTIGCFFGIVTRSQSPRDDFRVIDQQVKFVPVATPAELARQITLFCSTDMEKTRAIFKWITENINYRTRPNTKKRKLNPGVYQEPPDSVELKPLDERVAETVLENGVAVCDGYARLFKTLCAYAGVRAEVVLGYARTEASQRIQRFRPNHSWNAVMIDSQWHLLDVTWASGYISRSGNDYVRYYDDQYFITSPEQFIREHYPDDISWTLMDDPPLMEEFRHSPFKQKSFSKYKINSYFPQKGIIEAAIGDTIRLEITTNDFRYDRQISSDPFLDTSLYQIGKSALMVPLEGVLPKTNYLYVINRPSVEWLYVLYNDDLILRYRVKIKKPI